MSAPFANPLIVAPASKWPSRSKKPSVQSSAVPTAAPIIPAAPFISALPHAIQPVSSELMGKRLEVLEAERAEQMLRLRTLGSSDAAAVVKQKLTELSQKQHELESELAAEAARARLQPQMRVECDACEELARKLGDLEISHKEEAAKFKEKAESMAAELVTALAQLEKIRASEIQHREAEESLEEKLNSEFAAVTRMKEEISRKITEWRDSTVCEQETFKRELTQLKDSVDEVLTDSQKVQGSFQELNVKYKTVGEAAVKAMKQIETLKRQLSQVSDSHREASRIAAASEAKLFELERVADNLRDKNTAFEKRLNEAEELQENFKQNSKEIAGIKDSLEKVSSRQSDLEKKERDAIAFMNKLNGETASVRDWLTAIRNKQASTPLSNNN